MSAPSTSCPASHAPPSRSGFREPATNQPAGQSEPKRTSHRNQPHRPDIAIRLPDVPAAARRRRRHRRLNHPPHSHSAPLPTRIARAGRPPANRRTPRLEPPEAGAEIEPFAVTTDRLSLKWPAAADNVGVIGTAFGSTFEVATTAETRARLLGSRRQRPACRTDSGP